ncbi:hypothetical protein MB901379_00670 [Mycobacterium basiliense]|uniref:Transmembrane protein n=1 Tax=Mycobacterium basiliense TaxID=2094119 RepID=A0A3S4DR22_9MYCO|nr:hypothetical protein [Mycobacterium basiliense]VDM87135.1 hypothetical protein MB901379_00670 [Mycobacterium basiliense]
MADKDLDQDRDESSPGTEPFVPDFDTGVQSVPFVPDFDTDSRPVVSLAGVATDSKKPAAEPEALTDTAADQDPGSDAAATHVQSVTVPGRYVYLKWWKLLLVVLGVWFAAAEVGLSLFYWWFHTIDKTPSVFVVLVYVVVCTVGGLMLSMVQGRPMVTALSLAVMSSPFASVAAAAPLYGSYFCEHASRCLIGVIPY